MLLKCLIKRQGPTEVHLGGFRYVFTPAPEITGDNDVSVCEIHKEEYVTYLLHTGHYCLYEPKEKRIIQPVPEPVPEPQYPQSKDIGADYEKALRTMHGILEEMGGMKKTEFLILCKTKTSLSEKKLRTLFDVGQGFLWKIEKLGKDNAKLVTPLRFRGLAASE